MVFSRVRSIGRIAFGDIAPSALDALVVVMARAPTAVS